MSLGSYTNTVVVTGRVGGIYIRRFRVKTKSKWLIREGLIKGGVGLAYINLEVSKRDEVVWTGRTERGS